MRGNTGNLKSKEIRPSTLQHCKNVSTLQELQREEQLRVTPFVTMGIETTDLAAQQTVRLG